VGVECRRTRKGTRSVIKREEAEIECGRGAGIFQGAMAVPGFILVDIRWPHCLPDSFPFPLPCPIFFFHMSGSDFPFFF
jgi:hypothetical protein